ncbi:hypothetical protein XQ60_01715 [Salmonella enterica]|nr:hypothetical protein [Salmonella enterica]
MLSLAPVAERCRISPASGLACSGIRKSYYMVHCLNCGYLSLYRSSAVLSWLEKDNVQGGDNE